jgi:uncharacterized membrane protein (DUF485 family)
MSTWDELWDPAHRRSTADQVRRRPGRHAAPPLLDEAAATAAEARQGVQLELRRLRTRALVPLLGCYLLLLALCSTAPGLLGTDVVGGVSIGVLLLFGQFLLAFRVMRLFSRGARTELDPQVDLLRTLTRAADPGGDEATASSASAALVRREAGAVEVRR